MIDADDPHLTSYVLGELPPDESRALEVELRGSIAAQEIVQQLREDIARVSDAFDWERQANDGLTVTQHRQIHTLAWLTRDGQLADQNRRRRVMPLALTTAVAASLLIVSMTLWLLGGGPPPWLSPGNRANTQPNTAVANPLGSTAGAADITKADITHDTAPRTPLVAGRNRSNPTGQASQRNDKPLADADQKNPEPVPPLGNTAPPSGSPQ